MSDIDVYITIISKYRAFDRSGKLPFSIVFGLCRRSSKDIDPRPIRFNTSKSILNVPYALTHDLLTLHVYDPRRELTVAVNLNSITQIDHTEDTHVILPSPVDRPGNWKNCLTLFEYKIEPDSALGLLFQPGSKYTIRSVKRQGGKLLSEGFSYINETEDLTASRKGSKVFSTRTHGIGCFRAVSSMPWPPETQTRLRMCTSLGKDLVVDEKADKAFLEVSISNNGNQSIDVQTRGIQQFLTPRRPWQPDELELLDDHRVRVIDAEVRTSVGTLLIVNTITKTIVRATRQDVNGVRCPSDPRPLLDDLVTLDIDEPLIKRIKMSTVLSNLRDGSYSIQLEPRGMWWSADDVKAFRVDRKSRVPGYLYEKLIPPVILESDDTVEVRLENGLVSSVGDETDWVIVSRSAGTGESCAQG